MRPDFEKAKAAATALLLEQKLYSLRLDITKLRYKRYIYFDSMQHYCRMTSTTLAQLCDGGDCLRDGCTVICRRGADTYYIVLYNENAPHRGRRNFTLAHEVGHIYLGHQEDTDPQEQEANCFAAQLLAPEVLVSALAQRTPGRFTPGDVCAVFAVSQQAAGNRIDGLARFPLPRFSVRDKLLLKKLEHLLPDPMEPDVDF